MVSDKDQTIIHAFGVQQEGCECSLPALYVLDAQNKVRLAQVGDNIVDRATSDRIAAALAAAAPSTMNSSTGERGSPDGDAPATAPPNKGKKVRARKKAAAH